MRGSASFPKVEAGKHYHVRVAEGDVGRFVLVPGDPDRVPIIANFLGSVKKISEHREFTVYNGEVLGELVTVCSSGIGSPATAIVVEELARAGARTFLRVGTCGAIQKQIDLGDLIIAHAAVRLEGTSRQYVLPEYPAAADPLAVLALARASRTVGKKFHVGVTASTDSFYVGQSRPGYRDYFPEASRHLIKQMQQARVLCFEMESSSLFTICSLFGLRAGAIFSVIAHRVTDRFEHIGIEDVSKVAVEAVRNLIRWDREAGSRTWDYWTP